MKIVALAGERDSGKSTVLNNFATFLCNSQCGQLINSRSAKVALISGKDKRQVVQLGSKIICICSMGDNDIAVRDNFRFFVANKCDIAFSACRSCAYTKSVKELKKQATRLKVFPYYVGKMKETSSRQVAIDMQTVQQLYLMI